MAAKLYVIPGSHPCAAVEAALVLKGIEYRRVDLLPLVSVVAARIAYGATTVPGLRIDGERLAGSIAIMHRLDELVPEPPLLPVDGRERVLEAERWGEEQLQPAARRIVYSALIRRPQALESFAEGARLPLPTWVMRPSLGLVARLAARKGGSSDDATRRDLEQLPAWLDRIDAWIAEGVLNGAAPGTTPNAADLQIGSSLRLLDAIGDVRPLLRGRPCAALTSCFPPEPGHVDAGVLPPDWIAQPAAA